jgi:hypothetical protein
MRGARRGVRRSASPLPTHGKSGSWGLPHTSAATPSRRVTLGCASERRISPSRTKSARSCAPIGSLNFFTAHGTCQQAVGSAPRPARPPSSRPNTRRRHGGWAQGAWRLRPSKPPATLWQKCPPQAATAHGGHRASVSASPPAPTPLASAKQRAPLWQAAGMRGLMGQNARRQAARGVMRRGPCQERAPAWRRAPWARAQSRSPRAGRRLCQIHGPA